MNAIEWVIRPVFTKYQKVAKNTAHSNFAAHGVAWHRKNG